MMISFIRTVILYASVVGIIRLMGKRQLGELQPAELVVAIMISDLAAIPMESTEIPLISGIVPILVLMLCEVFVSFATVKSRVARNIFYGKPSILVQNGEVQRKELQKQHLSIDDLLEELRNKSCASLEDVEQAVLETNGQLSLILKSAKRPASPEDFKLNPHQEKFPHTVILDGKVDKGALKTLKISEESLMKKLRKYNIKKAEDVFYASLTDEGKLYFQIMDKE